MEILINALVECTDGVCGRSECILIDPVTDQLTHLIVKEDSPPHTEYLVSVDFVTETVADTIRLICSKAELENMDLFVQTRFIQEKVLDSAGSRGAELSGMGSHYYLPYVTSESWAPGLLTHQQIPPGKLAVHRGTHIDATDGFVGKVDEFVVNPENGYITHLVMREGHLWGQKDVLIPLSVLGDIFEDAVFLKIDKHEVELLPTFTVRRRWS